MQSKTMSVCPSFWMKHKSSLTLGPIGLCFSGNIRKGRTKVSGYFLSLKKLLLFHPKIYLYFGSGAISGKMLLVRIVENKKDI